MIKLLMLGDSLVEWGDWPVLLPQAAVVNRGFAGEMAGELASRLADEIEACPDPDAVLVQSGTNNILFGDLVYPAIFQTMIPRLRLSYDPRVLLIISSLMPMPIVPAKDIEQMNMALAQIASATENCIFLDMTGPFSEQCLPITHPGFLNDQVHLSTRGYQVWASEIGRCLKQHLPTASQG